MKRLFIMTLVMIASISTVNAKMKFEIKGPKQLIGSFKKYKIQKEGNTIKGWIVLKSMKVKKVSDKKELLEYFDAGKHPLTLFKAKVQGGTIEGTYKLKGETKKLTGIVKGKEAILRIPLSDLVTGFKAMFLSDSDHVSIKVNLK